MTMSRLGSMAKMPPETRELPTSASANFRAWRSVPQIPQASVFTRTSPGPGMGAGILSRTRLLLRSTTARMADFLRGNTHQQRAWRRSGAPGGSLGNRFCMIQANRSMIQYFEVGLDKRGANGLPGEPFPDHVARR